MHTKLFRIAEPSEPHDKNSERKVNTIERRPKVLTNEKGGEKLNPADRE
jgi:hypothetical protein